MKFKCFHCSSILRVKDKYVGRKGKCPKCGTKNTVPSPDDTIEDSIMTIFNDMDDAEDEEFEQQEKDSYVDDDGGNLPNG